MPVILQTGCPDARRLAVSSFRLAFHHRLQYQAAVTPAHLSPELAPEICAIPAVGLRAGFNTTYQQLLSDKGFKVRQLAAQSV